MLRFYTKAVLEQNFLQLFLSLLDVGPSRTETVDVPWLTYIQKLTVYILLNFFFLVFRDLCCTSLGADLGHSLRAINSELFCKVTLWLPEHFQFH